MCTACTTALDTAGFHVMVGAVVVTNAYERWTDRRRGIDRVERAQRTWLTNASFVRSMGMDPHAVLGPPPLRAAPTVPAEVAVETLTS